MLGNDPFYNRTIRKIVVAFGTIFNDIEVVRYTLDGLTPKERFKVPLSYGPKEKYITRITSDPTLTKSIATLVPRISFALEGISYDMSRKQITTTQNFSYRDSNSVKSQYLPLPYNFDFTLSIYVRNTEDGTQILEQILPFFTPDFTVTVNLNPEMTQKYDLPIILNSVDTTMDYEGDLSTTRLIVWDLTFTVKGFIFPPVKGNDGGLKIIKRVNTNIHLASTDVNNAQKVYVDKANGFGVYTTAETVRVPDTGLFGKVTYFSNTSIGLLILEDLNGQVKEGDTLIGDYSNARYVVSTVDYDDIKNVSIITEPNPINANVESDFGFTTTIIEL